MEPVFSVSEFNELVGNHLTLLGPVVVEGEISELKVSQNKWIYATLKDEDASVNLFGTIYQIHNLKSLEVGMQVRVTGMSSLYRKTARFSLNITEIVPSGEGALLAAYTLLKAELEKEGLFAQGHKRPLPIFPERIGLLTAKESQAYQDFVKVSSNRMGGFQIFFYPINVQGTGAVDSVLNGLQYFNQSFPVDLLVITRGGGSLEDLAAFNDERLVRAIFASNIPTVCAIGHEGDVSLVELAADLRASTPSNAAELIFRDRTSVIREIEQMTVTLSNTLKLRTSTLERGISTDLLSLSNFLDRSLSFMTSSVQAITHIHDLIKNKLDHTYQTVISTQSTLSHSIDSWYRLLNERISHLDNQLSSVDPSAILRRGYSILHNRQGEIIRSIKNVALGDLVQTTLADGKLQSTITTVTKE